MVGHPDFQDYAVWRGDPLITMFNVPFGAGQSFQQSGPVGAFPSFQIHAKFAQAGCVITVTFYLDAALTEQLATYEWVPDANMSLDVILPAMGDYVTVTFGNPLGVGTTGTVAAWPCALPTSKPVYPAAETPVPLVAFQGSIAAGTTQNLEPGALVAGPAMLVMANESANTWNCQLRYMDPVTLAFLQFARWDGSALGLADSRPVILPPCPVQIQFKNTGAAAATCVVGLVCGG
jgi:hypothetical protein